MSVRRKSVQKELRKLDDSAVMRTALSHIASGAFSIGMAEETKKSWDTLQTTPAAGRRKEYVHETKKRQRKKKESEPITTGICAVDFKHRQAPKEAALKRVKRINASETVTSLQRDVDVTHGGRQQYDPPRPKHGQAPKETAPKGIERTNASETPTSAHRNVRELLWRTQRASGQYERPRAPPQTGGRPKHR